MTETLSDAGRAAGLTDPDLLKLARTDIVPAEAIKVLRERFPKAFPQFNARTASKAEVAAEWAKLKQEDIRRAYAARDAADLARITKRFEKKDRA